MDELIGFGQEGFVAACPEGQDKQDEQESFHVVDYLPFIYSMTTRAENVIVLLQRYTVQPITAKNAHGPSECVPHVRLIFRL